MIFKQPLRTAAITLMAAIAASAAFGGWDYTKKYEGPKTPTTDFSWHPDILEGYEARYVSQGEKLRRPLPLHHSQKALSAEIPQGIPVCPRIQRLFLPKRDGERFVDSGFNFYAVDLRRYGRSLEPWQYPFDVRNQREYFADIDSALAPNAPRRQHRHHAVRPQHRRPHRGPVRSRERRTVRSETRCYRLTFPRMELSGLYAECGHPCGRFSRTAGSVRQR